MNRSRTKEFIKGTLSTGLLQIIVTLSGFVIPRVMITVYGSEINGIISSLTQFINYFTLIEVGLSGAAIYALYKPLQEENREEINSIVTAAKKLYTKSGIGFVLLVLILAVIFPIFTNISTLKYWEVFLLSFVIGMTGVLDFFTLSKYRVLLTADQRVYIISLASIAYYVVFTAIIAVASFTPINILAIRILALSAIFLRSLILVVYCNKKYSWLNFKTKPNYEAIKSKNDVLYQQICGMIQTGMPILLATFVVRDFKTVSVFSVYNMILTGINGVIGIFSTSLASGFGNLIVSKEKNLLRKTFGEFESGYQIMITIVYSTAIFLIVPFVKLYTADVEDINYILPVFACLCVWNGVLYNVKTPLSMLVVSAGMYRETRMQNTITSAIIIILGIPFTMLWGLNGIMIASIVSNIYRTIDFIFFVHKNITEDKPKKSILRILLVLVCMGIATVLSQIINFEIASVLAWVKYAIFIFIASTFSVLIIMGLPDRKNLGNLIVRIKNLINPIGGHK